MKTRSKTLLVMAAVLTLGAGLIPADVAGQTFTVLYTFTNSVHTVEANYGLASSGTTLFGTVLQGVHQEPVWFSE
jgi:hypothetical protein